ncbi:MAG: hypothetical protein ACLGJE_12940 [Gammaproteobacteria bacterium]
MTLLNIMDTDVVAFELIKNQRQWRNIKQNLNDAFEHWQRLSKDHLKEFLSLDPHNQMTLELTGRAIDKSFRLSLTPFLLEKSFLGRLRVFLPKAGTAEELIIAEYLLDNDGNISTQETGPKIDRETKNPNYTLLMNIIHEVLRH